MLCVPHPEQQPPPLPAPRWRHSISIQSDTRDWPLPLAVPEATQQSAASAAIDISPAAGTLARAGKRSATWGGYAISSNCDVGGRGEISPPAVLVGGFPPASVMASRCVRVPPSELLAAPANRSISEGATCTRRRWQRYRRVPC